jgi:hypothetical protein
MEDNLVIHVFSHLISNKLIHTKSSITLNYINHYTYNTNLMAGTNSAESKLSIFFKSSDRSILFFK